MGLHKAVEYWDGPHAEQDEHTRSEVLVGIKREYCMVAHEDTDLQLVWFVIS